jgi:serine/threonine protein kinase/Tfp pilus assembly protein PilF
MINGIVSHYKILNKIGSGGMGDIYKAEDIKLKRTVALKFLPVSFSRDEEAKRRLMHEAQSASALDHSNICTIYEIGETVDGQLFISMGYYKGETLKERITRGALGIDEVLSIILQVCEGLAKAHSSGIIHRDIKPANIFITADGVVKILDFGLAKSMGQTQLTKIGSAVGTISYMSPEQARGAIVDRRTDIWSLGVVLYEMLTGELPFKGDYEQAVIYSILNEEPVKLSHINAKVYPKLEDVVLKSLEKDKEERYQHMDDMLADLRKERKNLEYERAGYVKKTSASSVISLSSKDNESIQKNAEIKKYPLKIIIPAAIIILIVAVLFIPNPFKSNEMQNAGITSAGNSLAVMYFQNIPDPTDRNHTGDMLTSLLITSLSRVKGLDVISRERLLEIEKDMGQTDIKEVPPSLAIKIAKAAHVTTMLTGNILQMQPKLAVTTNLINVQTGRVIGSEQLTNFTESQIFNLVDSLSYLIRGNLEAGTPSLAETKSIADVTTSSPEAYRAYVEGLDLEGKIYHKEAAAAFERAVTLDTNFAMAYARLYWTQNILGETQAAQRSLHKAVELSDKTTEKERLEILALNYLLQNNVKKLIEVNSQRIRLYPHEITPYVQLGWTYNRFLLDSQKGVDIFNEGVKVNPDSKGLWNQLAYSLAYNNQKQDALKAVNHYIELAPAEPNPYDTEGDIYSWFMNYDSSYAAYQFAASLRSDFTAYKLGYYALLRQNYDDADKYFRMSGYSISLDITSGSTSTIPFPLIEIEKGQIKHAENKLTEILKSKLSSGEREYALLEMIHLYYETAEYPEMLRYAKEYSSELHKENPSDKTYGRDYVAWALVKNGKYREAHNLVDNIERDIDETIAMNRAETDYLSALVPLEEGKLSTALRKFRQFEQILPPNHEPNIFYAICLFKNGKTTDAVKELQHLLFWQGANDIYIMGKIPGEIAYWPIQSVKAHYWLGVAYQEQGKNAKAIAEYRKFLDIWKDADFNSPEIKDAKAQITKLNRIARN